jgi:hypothetical protein
MKKQYDMNKWRHAGKLREMVGAQAQCLQPRYARNGSLYLGIALALIFVTVFMGIVLQQALLFSSFVHKKQEGLTSFYAAEALAQYGVAYAVQHYDTLMAPPADSGVGSPVTSEASNQACEVSISFDRWPEHDEKSAYAGSIIIRKEIGKEKSNLIIEADLIRQAVKIRRLSCVLAKSDFQPPFFRVYLL